MDKLKFYSCFHKNEYFTHEDKSTLHMLSRLYMPINILNDRFNILNEDCEYNLISRNENISNIWDIKYKSFEECCFDRSTEIIEYSNKSGLDIYISWSGGVDSTCVVCSFLLNSKLNKNHFHVLYNKDSITEYPYFFNLLQKNNVSLINIDYDIYNLIKISENGIVVSGCCGDQLDGSNLLTKIYTNNNVEYFDNWIDGLLSCSRIKVTDKHISDIESYIKYTGLHIKYFGEFSWLFSFCIKWTYVSEYMDVLTKNKYYAFFDTLNFSRYALHNMQKHYKKKQNGYSYKTDFKKLIYKYTKDETYFMFKGKEATYIGGRMASPFFLLSTDNEKKLLSTDNKMPDSKLIYDTLITYIKPEYINNFIIGEM